MNNATQLIPTVANDYDPSRRGALKQLALACGLVLSASSLSVLAAGFEPPTDLTRSKKTLLNTGQLALVRELGDIIIPMTDTPGASAAGVHDFINHFVVYCTSAEEQQELLAGLKRIDDSAQVRFSKPFLSASKTQQIELLTNMEKAADGFTADDRKFFKQFKALVTFGYYTSEIGATQELAYLAIPGGYKGNVKFKQIGKAWALPY
jgi:hypothetical protein